MEITDFDASELSQRIHAREVSCREVMQAYLARIERVNPQYNAIVNLAPPERALAEAHACDAELARGHSRGWLHGIPQAIKDTGDAAGFPTTVGCSVLKSNVARRDNLMVSRMRAAGCIVIGKTNMPEFGLGSHTFNTLFGATPNAWDRAVSAGGSSGGAAVALAQRLLPVADGSDFMGSLRNPAGWNHVYGLRPTQGRVPMGPGADVWVDQLGTEGPMARSVDDLGRLLLTQSGHDPRFPLSLHSRIEWLPGAADPQALRDLRVGWLGDLGGHLAIEDGILPVCEQALQVLAGEGALVAPAKLEVDLHAVWDSWLVWRQALVGPRVGAVLAVPGAREQLKPEALWEHDRSVNLTWPQFMRASQVRTSLFQRMRELLEQHDVVALPVAQVWPFPLQQRWPAEIAGRVMETYHRWMEVTLYATFAGMPAISIPAGFHAQHAWPMGLQLIAGHGQEARLLRVAGAYEALRRDLVRRRPPSPDGQARD